MSKTALVSGREVTLTPPQDPHEQCDYCGELGHQWQVHPQARQDVREFRRTPEGRGRTGITAEDPDHVEVD